MRNAVTLVWGSLRLAPITYVYNIQVVLPFNIIQVYTVYTDFSVIIKYTGSLWFCLYLLGGRLVMNEFSTIFISCSMSKLKVSESEWSNQTRGFN